MSEARDKEMSTGLLRQRRNLMGISIVLPLYLFSGATLKEINIIGNKVSIDNPEIITTFLIFLFIYFLIRYWQYFNEEKHIETSIENFKYDQFVLIRDFVDNAVEKKFNSIEHRVDLDNIPAYFINNLDGQYYNNKLVSKRLFSRTFPVATSLRRSSMRNRKNASELEEIKKQRATLMSDPDWELIEDESKEYYHFGSSLELNSISIFIIKAKVFLKFIFTKSTFTDYYLPLVISSISFVFLVVWFLSFIKTYE